MTIQSYISAQKGVALVAALVVLLILTLIGVSSMNLTTLEEKMAINMQQSFSAFHIAETGLNQALTTSGSIAISSTATTMDPITVGSTSANVATSYRASTKPPQKSEALFSASQFQAAHFDVTSVGQAGPSGAQSQTTIRAGIYQILPGGL